MRNSELSMSLPRLVAALASFILASTTAAPAAGLEGVAWHQDSVGFEAVEDPAEALFRLPQPWSLLADQGAPADDLLDVVVSLGHDVPIGDGRTLRVNEYFTLRSWLRWPKRAVLLLSGTAARASFWSIPVPGYDGTEMAARRGFFAFTVDFIGVGDNYRPGADALHSTFEANQRALKAVLRYIRFLRAVPRVDLVGESWGGAHATQLAADPLRVRSCVMSSMTYKAVASPKFVSPEFIALLEGLPDNYLPNGPDFYAAITATAPAEVAEYARSTQPGPYLTTQLWQIIKGLPHFDPSVARVPGLVISGTAESADGRELAADYGPSGAELLVIDGAGHVPRVETPERVALYWNRVFEFIDPEGAAKPDQVEPEASGGPPATNDGS